MALLSDARPVALFIARAPVPRIGACPKLFGILRRRRRRSLSFSSNRPAVRWLCVTHFLSAASAVSRFAAGASRRPAPPAAVLRRSSAPAQAASRRPPPRRRFLRRRPLWTPHTTRVSSQVSPVLEIPASHPERPSDTETVRLSRPSSGPLAVGNGNCQTKTSPEEFLQLMLISLLFMKRHPQSNSPTVSVIFIFTFDQRESRFIQ